MKRHLVNLHIPKCAGTALGVNLVAHFPKSETGEMFILHALHGGEGPYYEGVAKNFTKQLPKLFDVSPRMLSGHFRYRDVVDILAPQRARISLITFLRDPVWRTLSDYYYSISNAHDDADTFRSTFPTFEHYMSNPGQMNKISDFLRLDDGDSAQTTLQHVCCNFDFVGITENFSEDLSFIVNSLGKTITSEMRENENRRKDEMMRAYEKFAPMLRDVLKEDYVIYNGVLEYRGFAG